MFLGDFLIVFLITARLIFLDPASECKLLISHDHDQNFIRSGPNCDNCDDNDGSLYAKSTQIAPLPSSGREAQINSNPLQPPSPSSSVPATLAENFYKKKLNRLHPIEVEMKISTDVYVVCDVMCTPALHQLVHQDTSSV